MARYRRINIDGKSLYKTETRIMAQELSPGVGVVIDENNQFTAATEATGRLYILDCAYHQGLTVNDKVPVGDSGVGNYVEEGREFALLCGVGTYKKDSPIKLAINGGFMLATDDTDSVIGYSQDDHTIASTPEHIRVRMRVGTVAPAPAGA